MKTFLPFVIVCILSLAGCRVPAPAPPPEDTQAKQASHQTFNEGLVMKGINLYMHRRIPLDGEPGKPELWVQADTFSISADQTYSFENAHAVVYGRDNQEITFDALRGQFQQDKSAMLEGEVRMNAGALKILLSDMHWTRESEESVGLVQTDNPVVIDDPDLQLNASGLRLHPDTRLFELYDVSGVVRFGKEFR